MSDHLEAQQVPPQPGPGGTPVPPAPGPGEVPNPMGDPTELPPPASDPDVIEPVPGPDVPPPMVA